LTLAVSGGAFTQLDQDVAQAMHEAWQPSLQVPFQLIAELGSVEVTTAIMLGLTLYLWRSGFGSDALVFVAFIAAGVFELYYKLNLPHLKPPLSIAQDDGVSVSMLLTPLQGSGNSFPSGHVMRVVIVYGLLAFVIRRLALTPWVRQAAVAGAIVLVALVSFDRLYLDVHWESDVIGGLVLGAIAQLAGTVWLDRPRASRQN
jgi:undecaprenyl-diphosphatase